MADQTKDRIIEAAYRTLLENIGTSYEEIRQVSRRGTAQEKFDLMTRLMMPSNLSLDLLFLGSRFDNHVAVAEQAVVETRADALERRLFFLVPDRAACNLA